MKRALAGLVALALAGCAVGPKYQRPDLGLPAAYTEGDTGGAKISIPPQWWKLYGDSTLDRLVDEGLKRNADVRLAAARVEEAQGALREAGAAFFPQVQGQANAARGRTFIGGNAVTGDLFTVGLPSSYEVDLWGRVRHGERAARDALLASRYGEDTVALTLAATVARAYFTALSLDSQYAASQESERAATESLDLARKRLAGGVGSELDVYQAGSLAAQTAAQTKEIARQRAAIVHQLGVLTGRLDANVPPKSLDTLPVPPLPPAGLPSQLLERRPDVRQAEATLQSATERIGVARANQFPTLSLTANLGAQSVALGNLFTGGAKIWSVGAGLLGPIFDAGRYAARTAQAEAQAKQAEASYQRTVETAFRDVSDALSNLHAAATSEKDLADRLANARGALRLAQLRYRSGYSAYLEVLDAVRTLNQAQLDYIRNHQAYLSYTVDLMNALGGGWSPH